MKTISSIRPVTRYCIEERENKADIILYDNIRELETPEEGRQYQYDTYRITVCNRPELAADVDVNYDMWLQRAKDQETARLAAEIRARRNALLLATDARMCLDRIGVQAMSSTAADGLDIAYSLSAALSGKWAEYRQALRDIPQQAGFPHEVEFPAVPAEDEI